MLTPDQLQNAARYQNGLSQIAEAIERLNDLGRSLGMNFCALHYVGAPERIWGQNFASIDLNKKLQAHYMEEVELCMQQAKKGRAA